MQAARGMKQAACIMQLWHHEASTKHQAEQAACTMQQAPSSMHHVVSSKQQAPCSKLHHAILASRSKQLSWSA